MQIFLGNQYKKTFTLALLLSIGFTAYSQTDTIRGNQFQLTGKIISKVPKTSDCGILPWGIVVEFQVINLAGIKYPDKNIGIVITCPEFYGKNFFKKGKTYRVIFSDKNQSNFGFVITNKEVLKKNGLTFEPYAILIERIK